LTAAAPGWNVVVAQTQSGSVASVQPMAQQPSPGAHWVMVVCVQAAAHVPAPTSVSVVQG
jgi:hypothetical protein